MIYLIVAIIVLALWLSTSLIGAIFGTVGLLLMGACTWYLPFPYDYNIPTGMLRLEGAATAAAIGFAPLVLRVLFVAYCNWDATVRARSAAARRSGSAPAPLLRLPPRG